MKRKSLISGAEYWDFNQEPKFVGRYISEHFNDTGKLIGYDFEDEQGEPWIISNSHSIEKAVELTGSSSSALLEIIFKGQTTIKKTGQRFNKFEINLLEEETEETQPTEPQQEPAKKLKKG